MTQVAPLPQQYQRFEMPSGASLHITIAPFQDSWALMKASLKTLKGMDLKSEDLKQELGTLLKNPSALTLILDRIVDFSTSPEVEVAMWRCALRALYIPAGSDVGFAGLPVNLQLFDDAACGISAREDYAKILVSLLEVNCRPFLAKILSELLKPKATSEKNLASK